MGLEGPGDFAWIPLLSLREMWTHDLLLVERRRCVVGLVAVVLCVEIRSCALRCEIDVLEASRLHMLRVTKHMRFPTSAFRFSAKVAWCV